MPALIVLLLGEADVELKLELQEFPVEMFER